MSHRGRVGGCRRGARAVLRTGFALVALSLFAATVVAATAPGYSKATVSEEGPLEIVFEGWGGCVPNMHFELDGEHVSVQRVALSSEQAGPLAETWCEDGTDCLPSVDFLYGSQCYPWDVADAGPAADAGTDSSPCYYDSLLEEGDDPKPACEGRFTVTVEQAEGAVSTRVYDQVYKESEGTDLTGCGW